MRFGKRAAVTGGALVAFLVGAVIAAVVGSSLISAVTSTANSTALGLSGTNATLVDLIPTMYIIMIIVGIVGGVLIILGRGE